MVRTNLRFRQGESMSNIYVYQIFYDQTSKAQLDPGFLPLDNTGNERSDWREYHPIRKYLLNRKLENDAYYGFLSPLFAQKTTLTADQVKSCVRENDGVDVVLFSPFFDQNAFYLNTFEQGEACCAGMTLATRELAKEAGVEVNLQTLVDDSTTCVLCNYFVARRSFWISWLAVAEKLYRQAETSPTGSSLLLTQYYGLHLKVYVMERVASLLLSTDERFTTAVYDPIKLPMLNPALRNFWREAIACDALKLAYRRLKNPRYVDAFLALRNDVYARSKTPDSFGSQRLP